ncbi:MAG: hypothetical protein KBC71_00060 [Candidatus Pacebacteria bacterium]|nr:hypothetical protein [Candidatus Paceibacterota bacterium]
MEQNRFGRSCKPPHMNEILVFFFLFHTQPIQFMRQFLALCTLLFLWCTATTVFAAPVTSDIGATQTTIVAALDQPAVLPSFLSSSNLIPASHLPGIVFNFSNATSGDRIKTDDGAGYLQKQVHPLRIKPIVTSNNYKDGDFQGLTLRYQHVNTSNNTVVGKNVICDYNVVANSANFTTALWTATDHDDGANQTQYFFLSNTAAKGSLPLPGLILRC